ncbi:hypothetical protein BIFANG_03344 [Bifidobacterium angulatum DSM 20098 = JCM 7096]|nr:hypothetical protein BIFANG_03344 [Bifidobacterium angulatum DSM 20098 = JCM 7096]
MCGEHAEAPVHPDAGLGSSPRVRGTLWSYPLYLPNSGIIPACAGNTRRVRGRYHGWWDHPRVCGEHGMFQTFPNTTPGSSPRVRGTLLLTYCLVA